MKHILFVSHVAELYGAPRSLLSIIKNIDTHNFRPTVVCFGHGGFTRAVEELGIPLIVIPLVEKKKGIVNRVKYKLQKIFGEYVHTLKLIRLVGKLGPDLVYVNTISRFSPLLASFFHKKKCIVHVRESVYYFYKNTLNDAIRIFLIKKVPCMFVAVSQAVKKLLVSQGIDEDTIRVVNNGIDPQYYNADENAGISIRKEYGIGNDDLVVGFVGNLTERKGIEFFIDMAEKIAPENKNVFFLVVGGKLESPRYTEELAPLVLKKKLGGKMFFTGRVDDTVPYYSAMDIFCMTSIEEPFARVNLEAMILGLPVVATDAGGNSEQVVEDETGYIVEKADIEEYTRKVQKLIDDKDRRTTMGNQGRDRVLRNFTEKKYVESINKVLGPFAQS